MSPPKAARLGASQVARGEIDFSLNFIAPLILAIDQGERLTVLGGVHPGCFELFAKQDINSLVELRGRSVGVQALGTSPHLYLTSMAAYVGLDPAHDINWVTSLKSSPRSFLRAATSTHFSAFRRSRRNCARRRSGMSSSTAHWTGPGRSTSVACCPAMPTL